MNRGYGKAGGVNMRATSIRVSMVIVAGCALSWQGCATPAAEHEDEPQSAGASDRFAALGAPVDESVIREMLGEDWPGYELGLPTPRAWDVGPLLEARAQSGDKAPLIPKPEGGQPDYSMGAFYNGHDYLIDVRPSEALSELVHERLDRALDEAVEAMHPQSDEEASVEPTTTAAPGVAATSAPLILHSPDRRKRLGILDGWSSTSWFATIGMVQGLDRSLRGSGTLISQHAVLTAAHAVIGAELSSGKAIVRDMQFVPRLDDTVVLTTPWGTWTRAVTDPIIYPIEFRVNGCHQPGNYTEDCIDSDLALVYFARPSPDPGKTLTMRYQAFRDTNMTTLKNRGYVDCSSSTKPSACTPDTLFGDNNYCQLDMFVGDDGGYSTHISHKCDTGTGHSGSPVYQYANSRPTIAGVHVADCTTDQGCSSAKNWMRHITPAMRAQIDMFVMMNP